MTRKQVVDSVLAKLDELTPFQDDAIGLGAEGLAAPVAAIATSLLDECAWQVLRDAPKHLCPAVSIPCNGNLKEGPVFVIPLPVDFIKLVSLELKGWQRMVTRTYPEDSEVNAMQKNRYAKAGAAKPVVIQSSLSLACYPGASEGTMRYVKRMPAEMLPEHLADLHAWLCAARVQQAMGRAEYEKTLKDYTQRIEQLR